MNQDIVNENSLSKHSLVFTDENGAVVTPDSCSYQIDDSGGTPIKTSTALSSPFNVLTIAAADNRILNQESAFETRYVTFTWAYGGGGAKQAKSQYIYRVRNLKFVV